jgi:hypothetical protein
MGRDRQLLSKHQLADPRVVAIPGGSTRAKDPDGSKLEGR